MNLMVNGGSVWQKVEQNGASQEEVSKARNQRNLYYQEYLKSEDIAIKDVQIILKLLSKEYKMAIITTSRRVDFEIIHKHTGIVEFMDFVLCEGEYEYSKPHGAPYLSAMKRFNAKEDECMVVEDSQRGLKSAIAANIDCTMVYNEFSSTQDFSKASYKIESLKDLEELLKSI